MERREQIAEFVAAVERSCSAAALNGDALINRMFEEIDGTRRRLLSMAAFGLAATKLGLVGPASAQSYAPGLPAVKPKALGQSRDSGAMR